MANASKYNGCATITSTAGAGILNASRATAAASTGLTWHATAPKNPQPGDVWYDSSTQTVVTHNSGRMTQIAAAGDTAVENEQDALHLFNILQFKKLPFNMREELIQFITTVKPILDDMLESGVPKTPMLWGHYRKSGNGLYDKLSGYLSDDDMINAHAETLIDKVLDGQA